MIATFSTDHFSYKDKVFSAEMSNFSNGVDWRFFQQLYPDACDQGFHLRSSRTGVLVTLYYDKVIKDNEGDVLYYAFVPVNQNTGFDSLLVFND